MLVYLSSVREGIPAILIPVALLPAAALLAVVFVCLRPPSLRQVAVMLDLRLNLRERLSTAMELIERGPQVTEAGLSEVIFAQAAGQARQAGVERMRFDSVSRPAAGALGLSVLLAVALLSLGGKGQRFYNNADEIGAAFANMSPEQKRTLAEELANAANSAPTLLTKQDLEKASDAALRDDPQAMKEAVARLKEQIENGTLKVVKVESPGAIEGHVTDVTNGAGPVANTPHTGNEASAAANSPASANSPDTALVLMPPSVKAIPDNQAPAAGNAPDGGSYVSFDKAWEQAVSQANQSLRDGQVPPRCRQLVRDYFLAGD
jgi:anti-sigma28 factor (negative regulator of flagellin synthesis)